MIFFFFASSWSWVFFFFSFLAIVYSKVLHAAVFLFLGGNKEILHVSLMSTQKRRKRMNISENYLLCG